MTFVAMLMAGLILGAARACEHHGHSAWGFVLMIAALLVAFYGGEFVARREARDEPTSAP